MRQLIKSISKHEWLFVGCFAALIVIVTAIPYLFGYWSTPAGMTYTGVHYLTPGDTNTYLATIESTKQGDNIALNLYTGEPQRRIFISPLWLSVGWLAKIFNLSNLLALHLARSLLVIIFVFIMYLLLAYLFQSPRKRKWMLILILFSSGLGAFFNPFLFNVNNLYEHPTDMWVVESITFLTLYHSPHVIASLILIVLIFLLMLLAFEHNKLRYSIGAGVAGFFLVWFHPFNGPTVYVTLGTFIVLLAWWRRRIAWPQIKHFIVFGCFPIPAALYLYLISRVDWVIGHWSAQNILPSPSIWMYLIGYGFLLIFALLGLWISLKKPDNKRIFIISWLISSAMLIYAPLAFQRRMSEGLHIPIVLLAGAGIFYLVGRWQAPSKMNVPLKTYIVVIFMIIFLPLSNIQLLGQDIYVYQTKKTLPYYLYAEEVAAMHWLRDNAGKTEIIFSSAYMGNFIPAYSGRIVWIGHGPQTINLQEKLLFNDWFWRTDASQMQKRQFLKENLIRYVFYGRKEREMGAYNPTTKDYLQPVYQNSQVTVYKVL
jgi:hypothetical protein